MATRTQSFHSVVAITDSFAAPYSTTVARLPADKRRTFNSALPDANNVKGIYIGGTGNYKVFAELLDSGDVIPFLDLPGGVFHRMVVTRILQDSRYTTDAPNILVYY